MTYRRASFRFVLLTAILGGATQARAEENVPQDEEQAGEPAATDAKEAGEPVAVEKKEVPAPVKAEPQPMKEPTPEERQKLIDEDPMLCWRPHFYMGDTPDTPPHQSLWVVEVPREMRKDELKAWKKLPDELKIENPLPILVPHAVGDQVVVTGKWSKTSPKGFANSDGLLVYESMENLSNPQEPIQQKP